VYRTISFVLPFLVYSLTLNALWASDHPNSLLDLQYALLVNHTAFFPQSVASNSVDISVYKDHYTSALAPGSAILSAPFGALGIALDKKFTLFGYERLFDELFVALCASISSFLVYSVSRVFWSVRSSFLSSLSFAFASLAWPYATVFFQHDIALLFVVCSLYFVLKHKPKSAGFSLGIALIVDYTSALFALPILWYLNRKRAFGFVLGYLSFSWTTFAYNYLVFGNPFTFPENYWIEGSRYLLSRFTPVYAPIHFLFLLFSPYRGLFAFSPILAFGFYGMFLMKSQLKKPATLFLLLFLVNIVFYSFWDDWDGGLCYGPRFLVESLPFLCVPISCAFEKARGVLKMLISVSYAYSVVVQALGALTSVFSKSGSVYFYQPLEFNLHMLQKGVFTTWWMNTNFVPFFAKVTFTTVLIFCLIIPFFMLQARHLCLKAEVF